MTTINDILFYGFADRITRLRADRSMPASDAEIEAYLATALSDGVTPPTVAEFRTAEAALHQAIAKAALDQTKDQLIYAVQQYLDNLAQVYGYDNIVSACSYAAVPNKFQAEAITFLEWRSAVWDYCYQVLADVQAGKREIPAVEQLLAELPQKE